MVYGKCRVTADVVWQVDAPPKFNPKITINKYVALIGHGPVLGPEIPPANVVRLPLVIGDISSGQPMTAINNAASNHYEFYHGNDGVTGFVAGTQHVCNLWMNDPGQTTGLADPTDLGQTYSKLAYLMGAWKSSDNKEPDVTQEVEVYLKGRIVTVYNRSETEPYTHPPGEAYSDNPAWVWLDILTNHDYGGGIPITKFDIPMVDLGHQLFSGRRFRTAVFLNF